jgi:hypothetical protein
MNSNPAIEPVFRAQFGEDRILWKVFRGRRHGYFIDVGAYDGVTISNTYFLEQMGWQGMLIEPIEVLCRRAAQVRPNSRVIHAALSKPGGPATGTFTITKNVPVLSFLHADPEHVQRCLSEGAELIEVEVPVRTLDDVILAERHRPANVRGPWVPHVGWQIDLVSIDVEGGEMGVLEGFHLERFKPRILVVENDRPAGAAIEPYLRSRGYRRFHRQKINDFYVRADDAATDLTLEGFEEGG